MPKVRDLPKGTVLTGKKLKSPKGVIGYYASQGNCVIMLSKTRESIKDQEGKGDETRLYPQIIGTNEDLLNWDVIEDESILVNCADLTSHKWTMCV